MSDRLSDSLPDTSKARKGARGSPAAQGFRLPAEWEPHEATWLGWPHNKTDWPGKFAPIPWVYAEIVRRIAPGESVRILASPKVQGQARKVLGRAGVDPSRIEFYNWPTDRGWTRDFGPCFIRRAGQHPCPDRSERTEVAIARFRFNAWAKYPDWRKDDAVPKRVAKALKLRLFPARAGSKGGRDVCLEGGSIDVNGRSTLLTTEECLLDQTTQAANPGLGRQDLERVFRDYLGVTHALWLGHGIAGDHTDAHP